VAAADVWFIVVTVADRTYVHAVRSYPKAAAVVDALELSGVDAELVDFGGRVIRSADFKATSATVQPGVWALDEDQFDLVQVAGERVPLELRGVLEQAGGGLR
jgi:hypothetical protein